MRREKQTFIFLIYLLLDWSVLKDFRFDFFFFFFNLRPMLFWMQYL